MTGTRISWLYNVIWRFGLPLIRRHLKKRARAGKEEAGRLAERYGQGYLTDRPQGRLIWLHAVSVGESVGALNLCRALAQQDADAHFIVSVNTRTAAQFIQKEIDQSGDGLPLIQIYQPLDHPDFVTAFLRYWRPDLAIFMESDFWFNLITLTKAHHIPVIFASSQLSDKAYANWRRRNAFAAALFGAADLILAVDQKQADYFSTLSNRQNEVKDKHPEKTGPEKTGPEILVAGSLKIDIRPPTPDDGFVAALKQAADGRPLILAASTHDGEELLCLEAMAALAHADVFMVFAPRHPVRGDAVMGLLAQGTRRFSAGVLPQKGDSAYLVDALGQMDSLFAAADLVLMGGSFAPLGGHNPLEPAAAGVPVLCGPHLFKNQADYDALIAAGQCRKLDKTDRETLTEAIEHALSDSDFAQIAHEQGPAYLAEACLRPQKAADYIFARMNKK